MIGALVYGTVDAKKMWNCFEDELYTPILVGDKAVVMIWFNNFTDTDCGGGYLETWYNTFVTPKDAPIQIPYKTPFSLLEAAALPQSQSFLMRVLCGDTQENPGAALKAITGGREIFGFPKHPIPAELQFGYTMMADGTKEFVEFKGFHQNIQAVSMKCKLPMLDPEHVMVPLDVPRTSENANIGSPRLGGRPQ